MFNLTGTDAQRAVANDGLARFTYPFGRLAPGLAAVGRTAITVEWADLSQFQLATGAHEHVHAEAHPIEAREQVMGLAWYAGKITLDTSLVREPKLAQEVLGAELAHMVDFFDPAVTPEVRKRLFTILHHGDETPHDHGWFAETGNDDYWSWVGEAWMGLFTLAYSDLVPLVDGFAHRADVSMVPAVRELLTPVVPPPAPAGRYYASTGSRVFHDSHKGRRADVWFATYDEAVGTGRRPCGICDPKP